MTENPGPTREGAESDTGHKIEVTVAECDVVAGPGRVEDHVAVQRERHEISRPGIDDPRANLDRIEGRGRDRADVTGMAGPRRALLGHMDRSASREGRGRRQT